MFSTLGKSAALGAILVPGIVGVGSGLFWLSDRIFGNPGSGASDTLYLSRFLIIGAALGLPLSIPIFHRLGKVRQEISPLVRRILALILGQAAGIGFCMGSLAIAFLLILLLGTAGVYNTAKMFLILALGGAGAGALLGLLFTLLRRKRSIK